MKITGPIDVIDIGGHPELELDESEYEAGYLATTIIAQTPIEYHRSLLRSIMLEHDKIEMGGDIDARFRVMQIHIGPRKFQLTVHKHGPNGKFRLTGDVSDEGWHLYEAGITITNPPLCKRHSIKIGDRIGNHVEGVPMPERIIRFIGDDDGNLAMTIDEGPWVNGIPMDITMREKR